MELIIDSILLYKEWIIGALSFILGSAVSIFRKSIYALYWLSKEYFLPDYRLQKEANAYKKPDRVFEIVDYWDHRPTAHPTIKKDILNAKSEIVIAGYGLTTVTGVLTDPNVVDKLASQINDGKKLSITIVMDFDNFHNSEEDGREDHQYKINVNKQIIKKFFSDLSGKINKKVVSPFIVFKKYNAKVIPRNFLLKIDTNIIYAGSYFSHKSGQFSYLIKIINKNKGLYSLFDDELSYILEMADEFNIFESTS